MFNELDITEEASGISQEPIAPELQEVLDTLERDAQFKTTAFSASRAAQLATSAEGNLVELADIVSSSPALTERVLRMANSAAMGFNRQQISNVDRAILVLGYDTVKLVSLLASLLDDVRDESHRELLVLEAVRSAASTAVARALALLCHCDPQRAATQSVLLSLGRAVVASQLPDKLKEIKASALVNRRSETEQARKDLGMSLEEIAAHSATAWNLDGDLLRFLHLPMDRLTGTGLSAQVASCMVENALQFGTLQTQGARLAADAFCRSTQCTDEELTAALREAALEYQGLAATLGFPTDLAGTLRSADITPKDDLAALLADEPRDVPLRTLHACSAEITARAAASERIGALVRFALESLIEVGKYSRAGLLIRDREGRGWVCQQVIGNGAGSFQQKFKISHADSLNLLSAALEREAGLLLSDTTTPKVRGALPQWFRAIEPAATSFAMMPMSIRGRTVAALYADRSATAPADSDEHLAGVRALTASLTLALRAAA